MDVKCPLLHIECQVGPVPGQSHVRDITRLYRFVWNIFAYLPVQIKKLPVAVGIGFQLAGRFDENPGTTFIRSG